MNSENIKIGVIGLGYVGLPLAVAFAKDRSVIGFDINPSRIQQLREGKDHTFEVSDALLNDRQNLHYTDQSQALSDCNVYIITVPTPIDQHKRPNLNPLIEASKTVGQHLKKNDVVIYESTVYPGATEQQCVPVLEAVSQLVFNQDFFCGYSPERINPGDKNRSLSQIIKVTSGSTPKTALFVDQLYQGIIEAGTHLAPSMKVAEAAKVIENTQRDLNVALINELAIIFNKLEIDTEAVLNAAGSKWNFIPFKPGLVGGHCIGVDPYYLTHCAESIGHHPEVILAGRRLNDQMGAYIAGRLIKQMIKSGIQIANSRILIMGFTFKENCPDIRNTRVIDIIRDLQEYQAVVDTYDPMANPLETKEHYGIDLIDQPQLETYDAILLTVRHRAFIDMGIDHIRSLGKPKQVIYDVKHLFDDTQSDIRL